MEFLSSREIEMQLFRGSSILKRYLCCTTPRIVIAWDNGGRSKSFKMPVFPHWAMHHWNLKPKEESSIQLLQWQCYSCYNDNVTAVTMTMLQLLQWQCYSCYNNNVTAATITMLQLLQWQCYSCYNDNVTAVTMTMLQLLQWQCLSEEHQSPGLHGSYMVHTPPLPS